jgi:protein-S-isoprenylcysteine O-methyltransferase
MSFPLIATVICACWWIAEFVRSSLRDNSLRKDFDHGSSRIWDIAHFIGVIGVLVGFTKIGHIASVQKRLAGVGVAMMLGGIAFRWLSIRSLGKYFSSKVRIVENHRLVRRGIYGHIRHPAYAGTLFAYLGMGLAFSNWISMGLIFLPVLFAAMNRMRIEEAVLRGAFGKDYADYSIETNRLIPGVY